MVIPNLTLIYDRKGQTRSGRVKNQRRKGQKVHKYWCEALAERMEKWFSNGQSGHDTPQPPVAEPIEEM